MDGVYIDDGVWSVGGGGGRGLDPSLASRYARDWADCRPFLAAAHPNLLSYFYPSGRFLPSMQIDTLCERFPSTAGCFQTKKKKEKKKQKEKGKRKKEKEADEAVRSASAGRSRPGSNGAAAVLLNGVAPRSSREPDGE